MHNLESLLAQGQELPSLPEIYMRISELLESEESNAKQIGDTVQTDPAITSRVLKMVNSAYYGFPHKVSSMAQAISLLGRQRLRHILIGSVLGGLFKGLNSEIFSMPDFWRHSIKTAIIAKNLASHHSDLDDPDTLFTAGLLHDIGRLILAIKIPECLPEIEALQRKQRIDIVQAEIEVVGFSHAVVSEAVMRQWGLPDSLSECARYHHDVEHNGEHATLTRIIYLANRLSQYVPPIDEEEVRDILEEIPNWQQCGNTVDQIGVACQLAEDQVFEVMESFGMVNIDINSE